MFTIEPKTFHDVIKPLIYSNCYAGLGAFRQPNQSDTTYFFMKLYTVVFTIVQWITIYVTLSSLAELLNSESTLPMAPWMYKTNVYTNSFISLVAPLLVLHRRKVMKDCLQQMPTLDDTYRVILGARNQYRKEYIRLTSKVFAIFMVMFLAGVCDTVLSLGSELQMSIRSVLMFFSLTHAFHHPILITLLLDMNFTTSVGYLGKKFRDINACLIDLAEKPSTSCHGERLFVVSCKVGQTTSGSRGKMQEAGSLMKDKHRSLRNIRKAHLELCELSGKINVAFGIQNLLSMGISFVMITGLLYAIYSAFSWESFNSIGIKKLIPSAIWTAIYVFKVFMVNHSCWKVYHEAERTGELIYELLNSRVTKELEREVQEFGVQLLQNPVSFDACGFFTLDYAFVQGVIGSITTYLVILIQMNN